MSLIEPNNYVCDDFSCTVGTDQEKYPNAVPVDASCILVIPKYYENKPIKAIGQHAFHTCRNIIEIQIEASITIIKTRAFSDMSGLKKVMLPSSLETVEECGLQFCNYGENSGIVQIIFGSNSQLKSLGDQVFGFQEEIIIYFTGTKSPSCHEGVFHRSAHQLVFAPFEFQFCNLLTISSQYFKTFISCKKEFHISLACFNHILLLK